MPESRYRPVDPRVSFPEMERAIARRWAEASIFERSVAQNEGADEWVFYEGPPTANNKPGIHHVEPRVFKDIFCRYHTMRGRYVARKAGWDCHGLPVEVEVEKELGITNKRQIEDEVGIAEFVRLCRESVKRYVRAFEELTERIAFWLDMDDAYWTMSKDYVESVWWLLKQIWDKGLLEEDFKVVPYCPRCETSLSNHEQHQTGAYKTVSDPSVYVRFPFVDEPDTALLVWTTTPWTLLANMAAAVGPDIDYVKVPDPQLEGRFLVVAKERVGVVGDDLQPVATLKGQDLVGRRYEPPYPYVEPGETGHRVVHADFVSTEDGTGIVHMAPYGEDDMEIAKRDDLPIVQMIDPSGRVDARAGDLAGLWVKDADPKIVAELDARDRLLRAENYEHAYPHCWRCGTPLLYYPRRDWYIRTSQIRSELMASNEETNWQPPSIKYGRFGDWLENNVDWSLSRDRYWGTPLPIWRCEQEHATCVGSFAELAELSHAEFGDDFDPHRPFVDDITFDCPTCGGVATRVTSVIDTWFDSGSMPFAQWHYPFENEDVFERRFPADFISEAIDQTRGWFYTLLAVATLVRGQNSYRNCVVLGHIVDGEKRKMSKSLGNVIEPFSMLDEVGADALRWYMFTSGTPWSPRPVSLELIQDSLRRYLLTLWNTYSFWVTYASIEGFDPTNVHIAIHQRPDMDRWILAELDDTIRETTRAFEEFDATTGGRRIDRFVDDLSNWYVRRSRRRFWRSVEDADTRSAFLTLWECLVTVARLTAPYTPFIADEIFVNLTANDDSSVESVHLSRWPEPDGVRVDDALRDRMALLRRLVVLGRAARTEGRVKVRQPLAKAFIVVPDDEYDAVQTLIAELKDELNVKAVVQSATAGDLADYSVKPNFARLGPRFGRSVGKIQQLLSRQDAAAIVAQLDSNGMVRLDLDGESVDLERDDLDIRIQSRPGLQFVSDGPYGLALDVTLDDDLRAEGLAREVVRTIQELRKSSGLAVEDRIELWIDAGDDAANALRAHGSYIAEEVLALTTRFEPAPAGAATARAGDDVVVALVKAGT